jgi:hypothetical protein
MERWLSLPEAAVAPHLAAALNPKKTLALTIQLRHWDTHRKKSRLFRKALISG